MNPLNLLPSKNLLIQYALLAAALLAGGALLTTVIRASQQEKKIDDLSTLVTEQSLAVNNRDVAIQELEKARQADATAIKNLEKVRLQLVKASKQNQIRLQQLESSDEAVRVYLNTPIPDSLAKLLNEQATSTSDNKDNQPQR